MHNLASCQWWISLQSHKAVSSWIFLMIHRYCTETWMPFSSRLSSSSHNPSLCLLPSLLAVSISFSLRRFYLLFWSFLFWSFLFFGPFFFAPIPSAFSIFCFCFCLVGGEGAAGVDENEVIQWYLDQFTEDWSRHRLTPPSAESLQTVKLILKYVLVECCHCGLVGLIAHVWLGFRCLYLVLSFFFATYLLCLPVSLFNLWLSLLVLRPLSLLSFLFRLFTLGICLFVRSSFSSPFLPLDSMFWCLFSVFLSIFSFSEKWFNVLLSKRVS